jgi:hypothetical protein
VQDLLGKMIFRASHQLPSESEARAALASFMEAAAAAEAAQLQLLEGSSTAECSSPLAQLLAKDGKLLRIAEAYSKVQRLHHKAIQQKLQQYGSEAAAVRQYSCNTARFCACLLGRGSRASKREGSWGQY